jgi:hypothetical protein
MKLPLFHRSQRHIQRAQAQDRLEKLLVESLRLLGQTCAKVADLLESQRLERQGYSHGTFLRRTDLQQEPKAPRKP